MEFAARNYRTLVSPSPPGGENSGEEIVFRQGRLDMGLVGIG